MHKNVKNKIINTTEGVTRFVKENLVRFIIVLSLFIFLEFIKSFPYINIIPNYQFLAIGIVIFVGMVLFRLSIPNRKIISMVVFLFVLAIPAAIFEAVDLSDLIGFIVFILITFITIRQIITERPSLKKMSEK